MLICNEKAADKNPIRLTCGTGESAYFESSAARNVPFLPDPSSAVVAQVTSDTSGMHAPMVEIDFSCITGFIASYDDAKGVLHFRLYRHCGHEDPVLLNTWTYELMKIEDFNTIRLSGSYGFVYCDTADEYGCRHYFVEVSTGYMINLQTLSVTNNQITAIAQGGDSICH
jgi:hypothetical protein